MTTTFINKKMTTAQNFAYDGCHKIYLIEDMTDMENAKKIGYKIYPITDIEKIWNESCSLRFINNWKLDKSFVSQFKKAKFEFSEKTFIDVVFKKFKDGQIIAIMPYDVCNYDYDVTSYMHIGQHGACDLSLARELKTATENEYSDLKKELENIGYELRVLKRINYKKYQIAINNMYRQYKELQNV